MYQNLLFRMERFQKQSITILLCIFIILSVVWFIDDGRAKFPFEPLVVLVGGMATLFANWWPFKAPNWCKSHTSRVIFDYKTNSGIFNINAFDKNIDIKFSEYNGEAIYVYCKNDGSKDTALVPGGSSFSDVRDVLCLNYNRVVTVGEGCMCAIKYDDDSYMLVIVHDVKCAGCGSDKSYEVIFSWSVNLKGFHSFAEY